MSTNPRIAFFDGIAGKWDSREDLAVLERRLADGLGELGVGADETVLDVGCGTGNLTRALLSILSPAGLIHAIDISARMIEVASQKVPDLRVFWHVVDASQLPLRDATCDRVICCSVWPHFSDHRVIAAELKRVLKPGGHLHVWHLASRHQINEIHASAGEAVRQDLLLPATETAELLASVGFRVTATIEAADRYLVTVMKPLR